MVALSGGCESPKKQGLSSFKNLEAWHDAEGSHTRFAPHLFLDFR